MIGLHYSKLMDSEWKGKVYYSESDNFIKRSRGISEKSCRGLKRMASTIDWYYPNMTDILYHNGKMKMSYA